jgi:hypothetical protein
MEGIGRNHLERDGIDRGREAAGRPDRASSEGMIELPCDRCGSVTNRGSVVEVLIWQLKDAMIAHELSSDPLRRAKAWGIAEALAIVERARPE